MPPETAPSAGQDRITDTAAQHDHDGCLACRNERYAKAQADPVASVVLEAMHEQDAATYNGLGHDMGRTALDAAAKIRKALRD